MAEYSRHLLFIFSQNDEPCGDENITARDGKGIGIRRIDHIKFELERGWARLVH